MRRYLSVFLFAIALIFSSCKKEYSCENCKPVKYLASFIISENNGTTPVFAQEFDYDDQKRVVEFREGNTSADGKIVEQKLKHRFLYEGASRQPYMAYYYPFPEYRPDFLVPVHFQYDQQGRKIADSVYYVPVTGTTGGYSQALNYSWSGNMQFSALSTYTPAVSVVSDTLQFSGQNIAQYNVWGITSLFQYDTGINPYYKMNIGSSYFATNPSYGISSSTRLYFYYIGLNKNNMTEANNLTHGYKINFNYTYDNDGYPAKATFVFSSSPDVTTTVTYLYTQ